MRIAYAVALFATIVALGWGAISQHSPQRGQTVKNQAEHQKPIGQSSPNPPTTSEHANNWWEKTLTDPVASFTGVLAVFTLGLIVVGVRQEIHFRDTARKELRAYLGIPDPIVQRIGYGNHFQVQVTVTNTGRTPAMGVRRWMLCKLVNKDEPIVFAEHKLHPANRPIPPDSKWHLREDFAGWSDEDLNAITKYDKILWVWGQVSYQDIYGKSHTTNFRLRSLAHRFQIVETKLPTMPRALVTDGWTLEPDTEGNDLS